MSILLIPNCAIGTRMQTVYIFLLPLDDLLLVEFLDELLAIA